MSVSVLLLMLVGVASRQRAGAAAATGPHLSQSTSRHAAVVARQQATTETVTSGALLHVALTDEPDTLSQTCCL